MQRKTLQSLSQNNRRRGTGNLFPVRVKETPPTFYDNIRVNRLQQLLRQL